MFKLIGEVKGASGFTLVEAIVGMSIALIGIAGGYALLANIQGTAVGNRILVQAQQEARNVVEYLAREIRESSPDQVLLHAGERSEQITFWTPRNENREFVVDGKGEPEWQRWILYRLEPDTTRLHRYQFLESLYLEQLRQDPGADWSDAFHSEIISRQVESVNFQRVGDDMIVISVRAFAESDGKVGHVARSYADFSTMVKLRN
jgi:type II secretory pathway component PulJ